MAESERMRQELEQLQKKISKLNVNRDVGTAEPGAGGAAANVANAPSSAERGQQQPATEKEELANELQMIESTIRERENEITVNQLRMAAAAGSGADTGFAVDGVDYGLSGSPAGGRDKNLLGIMTTATSGLSPKTRGAFLPDM